LPIVAVPWGYVFANYFYKPKRYHMGHERASARVLHGADENREQL
jgi:hypothetical protein